MTVHTPAGATAASIRNRLAVAGAICVVIDRQSDEDRLAAIEHLGGGWKIGVDMFRTLPTFSHLILLAATRKRIKSRAPLVLLNSDIESTATFACSELSSVTCAWIYVCGEETAEIVQRIALADAGVGGTA